MGILPSVTVAIPTCNRMDYLGEALDAVARQTFQDYRIFISDNGSTDGTPELVQAQAKRDPRIHGHRFPRNVGMVRNWQRALCGHQTEFVALLNDDDLWLPDHLAAGIEALRAAPDAAFYFCVSESFGASSGTRYAPALMEGVTARTVLDTRRNFVPMLHGIPALPSAMIFRRHALDSLALPDVTRLGPIDWLVSGQAALHGSAVYDPVMRVKYRLHQSNISYTFCRGKVGAVQMRYVFRTLAEMALAQGALTGDSLVEEIGETWEPSGASTMVVALAARGTHPELRRAAFAVMRRRRREFLTAREASNHCRVAALAGSWYLSVADALDIPLAKWPLPTAALPPIGPAPIDDPTPPSATDKEESYARVAHRA